jgi:hypothetical protein
MVTLQSLARRELDNKTRIMQDVLAAMQTEGTGQTRCATAGVYRCFLPLLLYRC